MTTEMVPMTAEELRAVRLGYASRKSVVSDAERTAWIRSFDDVVPSTLALGRAIEAAGAGIAAWLDGIEPEIHGIGPTMCGRRSASGRSWPPRSRRSRSCARC